MSEHKTKKALEAENEELKKAIELLELDRHNLTNQNMKLVERIMLLEGQQVQEEDDASDDICAAADLMDKFS